MITLATFDQWKTRGYIVRFGQKAKFISIDGNALFSKEQVALVEKGWQPLLEDPTKEDPEQR